jgi:hypothetical protein
MFYRTGAKLNVAKRTLTGRFKKFLAKAMELLPCETSRQKQGSWWIELLLQKRQKTVLK